MTLMEKYGKAVEASRALRVLWWCHQSDGGLARERGSDMRTYQYELWQKVKYGPEDENGDVETIRGEERIGKMRERFSAKGNIAAGSLSGDALLEFLQDHLKELADAGLKLADVEVRARPFPA